eukprot:TRINITY_DN20034_c0_g1_i1.p1 TRINITY_DN20034_c0_g1~~TRINITY_DN20034_c0_g1_i1.p1  ORF type:complete len:304 (-),score=48.17 TRINITY_DN20034_c0_g1_i1:4-915(-)
MDDTGIKKQKKKKFGPKILAHKVKNNVASAAANPLFKRYMPDEIQQLLEYFIDFLERYAVGATDAKKMRVTIVKSLVELFVMFDSGLVPESDFEDVYQLFRRTCSLVKNTYLRKQVTIVENQQANSTSLLDVKKYKPDATSTSSSSSINLSTSTVTTSNTTTKEDLIKKYNNSNSNSSTPPRTQTNPSPSPKPRGSHSVRRPPPERPDRPEKPRQKRSCSTSDLTLANQGIDPASIARLSELIKHLNREIIAILTPLKLTKVSMEDMQAIFDAIAKEKFITDCFKDVVIPKVVCILADFLENY